MMWFLFEKSNDLEKYEKHCSQIMLIQSVWRMYTIRKIYKPIYDSMIKIKHSGKCLNDKIDIVNRKEKVYCEYNENEYKNKKVYQKLLDDEIINLPKYRNDFKKYLNSNFEFSHIEKYEKYGIHNEENMFLYCLNHLISYPDLNFLPNYDEYY